LQETVESMLKEGNKQTLVFCACQAQNILVNKIFKS